MKNFFVVSAVFCILTGTSTTAFAQPSPNFIEGIEIGPMAVAYGMQPITSQAPAIISRKSMDFASNLTENCKAFQFKFAQILNREVESLTNFSLFSFIDEWWDTRYRYGGKDKSGIDCSAFTSMLISEVYGKALPRTAKEQYTSSSRIGIDELSEGDLVFFNTRGGISHVGVYISDGYFVHASTSSGVTINNLAETYYSSRYKGGGKL